MKKLAVGILAHVDAGKTTLSEALLYLGGQLRKLGRVDHRDAFLDTDKLERERGITIFSKQAVLPLEGVEITLLDTPGHVDFSSEMERTLQVMDYAILVVSGTDGLQSHTRTLWHLLERYRIPTFIFVNKMDLSGTDRQARMEELRRLSDGCVDFTADDRWENAATGTEAALEEYLETGALSEDTVAELIQSRRLFPCYFGSALRLVGVEELLRDFAAYTRQHPDSGSFAARVFKISRDGQGNRLTHLKLTGGTLQVKTLLSGLTAGEQWEEKVDQIRIYSGAKFTTEETVGPGAVCAVTGLSHTFPGQGLGVETAAEPPSLTPVLTYQVILPEGCDPHTALKQLWQLEEEDPQLRIVWNEQLRQIHVRLMGEVQLEILRDLIRRRFGLEVSFGEGSIVYRETIAAPVEGAGHFEPLRHYAEVHLLLEPGERGSGLRFDSICSEDQLERNWQRLILTHLEEKTHVGVLTGSPITDMKITLTAGRAHVKHTEGGDFRQATYRALRQGLMSAESVLLEPWYDFRLELPTAYVGRAMTDLQQMNGRVDPPVQAGEETVLTGSAPVARLRHYAADVTAYTRGQGRLSCTLRGYEPCADQAAVVETIGYDPLRDTENPADSVFCSHGAGVVVRWDEAPARMHVSSPLRMNAPAAEKAAPEAVKRSTYTGSIQQDKELAAIFERTYGPVKRRDPFRRPAEPAAPAAEKRAIRPRDDRPEYLLVDGYNIIFAWEELKTVARDNLDAARKMLMDILSNYQGFRKCVVILVFDAYKVPNNPGSVTRYHNIHVVYTKEAETADAYIERATYDLGREHKVRVATSDGPEQLIILGHGALRVSASAFRMEVEQVEGQIAQLLRRNNQREKSGAMRQAMEQALEENKP